MSYFLWHTIADPSANMLGILDEEHDDRYKLQFNWNYQLRDDSGQSAKSLFIGLWPTSSLMGGDPLNVSGAISTLGMDAANVSGVYEPRSNTNTGTARYSFVMGNVQFSGSGLASVTLDLFLASTNQLVSTGATDTNGNYMLPTPYAGQNHYIYANYSGGTYVGASVATLLPNF